MRNRLVLLWHKFCAWLMPDQTERAHHAAFSEPYHPSNLHARRYR
jgi:hypothetical protein